MKKNILVIFAVCLFIQTSFAATYTVTKTDDTNDGVCDADCSLREAMAVSNSTADNDVIEFSSLFDTAQTITLTSGSDLIMTTVVTAGTLTINGKGANKLTISGNNTRRVFSLPTASNLTLNGMTITGGNGTSVSVSSGAGGGIYVTAATLNLDNVTVTGNSTLGGSAGGGIIYSNVGNVGRITNSTISNNTAASSGGIQANGSILFANTTISGNTSTGTSGVCGGGLRAFGGTITVVNSTITNNSSANTTIGGGGLCRAGTVTVNMLNTILAGNTGASDPDFSTSTSTATAVFSSGNNIVGVVGTRSTGWIATDLINTAADIGALANNGGQTNTHLPNDESPAIEGGNNCVVTDSCGAITLGFNLTTDQRGLLRQATIGFLGVNVDIGSTELQAAPVAANVSISGKVKNSIGRGISKVNVTLTNSKGETLYTTTNNFGNYSFDELQSGETYILSVASKRHQFAEPSRIITINEDLTGFDFVSN
jgi:CSLREA domain-containing protein